MEIYFETERECDKFKSKQKCNTRKYYDKTTESYYLILFSSYDWLNRELKPNLIYLDEYQKIYNDYCNIVRSIEKCMNYNFLSEYEKEQLPKLLKSFNKFRDHMRNTYDTIN